jgi:hypothetical protein
MPLRRHVVITGTGRAGTTFLVELLTHLGLDTGFNAESLKSGKYEIARAGLEHDIRQDNCPFIVKSPWFCDYAEKILRRDDIAIEHVFILMRDLYAAAESRRHVVDANVSSLPFRKRLAHKIWPLKFAGGLWYTRSRRAGKQEKILLLKIYQLLLATSGRNVPVTLMRYPEIVDDCPYLYAKLKPLLRGISYASFASVFHKVARPELVHHFEEQDAAAQGNTNPINGRLRP